MKRPRLDHPTLRKYFLFAGVAAHIGLLTAILGVRLLLPNYSVGDLLHKANQRLGDRHPTVASLLAGVIKMTGARPSREEVESIRLPPFPGPEAWPAQGPTKRGGFLRSEYDHRGVPQEAMPGLYLPGPNDVVTPVTDSKGLLNALRQAKAGHVITLAPGAYRITAHRIKLGGAGSANRPIVVRAERLGDVRIELDTLEGFYVNKPYWVFENLSIHGSCARDSRCEHAFHVVGDGVGTVLRNNEILDFNAPLKVNGLFSPKGDRFPDNGLVHNNAVYNTRVRDTNAPVTMLNINGGNGWVVSANFIADFAKGRGNRISYAAFMKSNSRHGVFERNLVVCHWRLPPQGDVRLGLSFGGGGTASQFCRGRDNSVEHTAGVIRNNVIMRCPVDVGIYLNKSASTRIYNNALIGTRGIDVRFATSSASLYHNVLDGRIADRDGGTHRVNDNLEAAACGIFERWFGHCGTAEWYNNALSGDLRVVAVDEMIDWERGAPTGGLDFCGNPRHRSRDIGPIEYGAGPLCLPESRP